MRCGTFVPAVPSQEEIIHDIFPSEKVLYTREGHPVTVVALHMDDGERCSGETVY